ncbi:NB-ARC domain-containing protein [Nonomuraea sp. NPDC049269]|uniref:NB-ARC domain-containing protein n=1 Tax=Nonomuraea sp. NPDC049269 TaxID=3364349 RepID=UPI00371CCF0E
MARRRFASAVVAGLLGVVAIGVGLPVNVVSEYIPAEVQNNRPLWIGALAVAALVTMGLTWLAPGLAEQRFRGELFQIPPLSRGWVVRPELADLVQQLRIKGSGMVGITTGLVGAGGFGKTSLAAAACHNNQIRRHFSGGIVWITVGQERSNADVATLLIDIITAIEGNRPPMSDPELLSHHLAAVLARRGRVLLVVDDIWNSSQLKPFLPAANKSRLLVTTRLPRTLPHGSDLVKVDAMPTPAARNLLTRDLPPLRRDAEAELLRLTGCWPLLLALVNTRLLHDVGNGAQVAAAADRATTRLRDAGPMALDIGEVEQRETAVQATVEYSLGALSGDARARFMELAIFPEDADIPIDLIAMLWCNIGLNAAQAQQLCDEFAGLSLVSIGWVDGSTAAVRMHDVIRAYILASEGMGKEWAQCHLRLIDAVRASTPTDGAGRTLWWELSFEADYLWRHLVYHLNSTGCQQEVNDLACDIRWIVSRILQSGPWAMEGDLRYSTTKQAAQCRRLIARSGYLLENLESRDLSTGNILSHLNSLPILNEQIQRYYRDKIPYLAPTWLMPESVINGLIRTLPHHAGEVHAAAMSPDGAWLASASEDGTVRLCEADGSERATLSHKTAVLAVAISPDSTWLASGSYDGTVRLWEADGSERATLAGHTDWVSALVISPDGAWLASASEDGTVRLWGVDGSERIALDHNMAVCGLAISPDGAWLASASVDGTVRLWGADGSERATLAGHTDWVRALVISPDGAWLASASEDGTVRLWGVDGSERIALDHNMAVCGLAISPDGAWLASGSRDGTVRLWEADGSERATLAGHTGPVYALAISSDGTWLASGSFDSTVRLWEADGSERATLTGHTAPMDALMISSDGTWLASASDDGTVRLWESHKKGDSSPAGHGTSVTALAISPDGTWLASASEEGPVRLWEADGSERATLAGHTKRVNALAISPNGAWLASASVDGTVRLWQADGSKSTVLARHGHVVTALAISPDGTWVASCSYDQTLQMVRWREDEISRTELFAHRAPVLALAISPDGTWLASASGGGTVRLWEADGSERAILTGHTSSVNTVTISPDGTWLASASDDGTVRLWEADGSERAILTGHTDWVHAVAISPDGTWLASASDDGTVRLWEAAEDSLCRIVVCTSGWLRCLAWLPDGENLAAAGAGGLYLFAVNDPRSKL